MTQAYYTIPVLASKPLLPPLSCRDSLFSSSDERIENASTTISLFSDFGIVPTLFEMRHNQFSRLGLIHTRLYCPTTFGISHIICLI